MATIYEKTPGALIATPGRTVATFPGGLCRVDQTYVCTTASAATHRASLVVGGVMPDGNNVPSSGALSISPAPQEVERGDGFTEFKVSAYGRTAGFLPPVMKAKKNIVTYYETSSSSIIKGSISYKVLEPSGTICLRGGDTIEEALSAIGNDWKNPFDIITSGFTSGQGFSSIQLVGRFGPKDMARKADQFNDEFPQMMPKPNRAGYFDPDTGGYYFVPASRYRATFIAPVGSTWQDDLEYDFYVYDPIFTVISKTSYGNVSEVSFTSERIGFYPADAGSDLNDTARAYNQ
jgi:hypothetical protein